MENATANPTPTPTPTIDTSRYDACASYDPVPKDGTYLATILDFAPGVNPETSAVESWKLIVALAESAQDDVGGTLPEGHRVGPCTMFTSPSQYRTQDAVNKAAKSNVMALNGIVKNQKTDPHLTAADQAFAALDATKKTPLPDDANSEHYKQWVGTVVLVRLKAKADKESGVKRVNIMELLARETPRR